MANIRQRYALNVVSTIILLFSERTKQGFLFHRKATGAVEFSAYRSAHKMLPPMQQPQQFHFQILHIIILIFCVQKKDSNPFSEIAVLLTLHNYVTLLQVFRLLQIQV